jgi:predicted XRE-type DNA-binding protein
MRGTTKKATRQKVRRPAVRSKAKPKPVKIVRGSDNVFADIGLEAPEEELAKAKLVLLIKGRIEELGLNQTQAASRMGAAQPKVSKLLRGDTSGVSTGWLMTALVSLGKDVEICVKAGKAHTGRLYVFAC